MAGFNQIKRKIIKQVSSTESIVVFEDLNPFEVEYQKFYDNEDMLYFSHELFRPFKNTYPEGVYTLEIDTLGAYLNSKVTYQIKQVITALALSDNLGILGKTPIDIEEDL